MIHFFKSFSKFCVIIFAIFFVFILCGIKILTQIVIIPFKVVANYLLQKVLQIVTDSRKFLENNHDVDQTNLLKILTEIDKDIKFINDLNNYIKNF